MCQTPTAGRISNAIGVDRSNPTVSSGLDCAISATTAGSSRQVSGTRCQVPVSLAVASVWALHLSGLCIGIVIVPRCTQGLTVLYPPHRAYSNDPPAAFLRKIHPWKETNMADEASLSATYLSTAQPANPIHQPRPNRSGVQLLHARKSLSARGCRMMRPSLRTSDGARAYRQLTLSRLFISRGGMTLLVTSWAKAWPIRGPHPQRVLHRLAVLGTTYRSLLPTRFIRWSITSWGVAFPMYAALLLQRQRGMACAGWPSWHDKRRGDLALYITSCESASL